MNRAEALAMWDAAEARHCDMMLAKPFAKYCLASMEPTATLTLQIVNGAVLVADRCGVAIASGNLWREFDASIEGDWSMPLTFLGFPVNPGRSF